MHGHAAEYLRSGEQLGNALDGCLADPVWLIVGISRARRSGRWSVARLLRGGEYFYVAQASPNWKSNAVERLEVRVPQRPLCGPHTREGGEGPAAGKRTRGENRREGGPGRSEPTATATAGESRTGDRPGAMAPGERVPVDPLQRLTDQAKGLLLTSSVSCNPCAIAAVEISRLDPQFVEEGCCGVSPLANLAIDDKGAASRVKLVAQLIEREVDRTGDSSS